MTFIFLALGIGSLGLGLLLLVSSRFVSYLERTVWRRNETELERKMFPGEHGYFVSRYLAGVRLVIAGIAFIILYAALQ